MLTKQKLDRPLAGILVTCRDYYRTNVDNTKRHKQSELYKLVQKALTSFLRAMAGAHATSYSGYTPDKDHPGYLIKLDPPMLFRVPYHVLPTFPTGDELEALWRLSRSIRSGNRSVISLSGSNVLRKIFELVGDVDFCEYFPVDDTEGFGQMASNIDGTTDVACLRLAFNGKKWHLPWGEDRPTKEFFAKTVDSSDNDKATMKVDYVGDVGNLGVTEISNLIIMVDKHWRSAAFARTFAAQEAPLSPIDWLPNQMDDPVEMGRYIDWLINSIIALNARGDMRKCLKRCASLSRVIFDPGTGNDIIDLISRSTVLLSHKVTEVERLSSLLKSLPDARSQRLLGLVEQRWNELSAKLVARGGAPDEFACRQFDAEAVGIVNRLLDKVRIDGDASSRRAA